MRRSCGFTLIELVGVLLIVSVGFLGLAQLFSNMNLGLTKAESLEKTVQYAQACADYYFQTRRDLGYSSGSLTTTMCTPLLSAADSSAGYTVAPGVPVATAAGTGTCPTGATCKSVTITASGGGSTASVILTLVNY
jgi:type II secretory pathway pseudopilin PulG